MNPTKWKAVSAGSALVAALGTFSACVPQPPLNVVFNHKYEWLDEHNVTAAGDMVFVGQKWIDSGTANGSVPVMLIVKFDANGNVLWRKTYPENPSADWLAHYAGLADRDDDAFRSVSVDVAENGDIYVLNSQPSDAAIMAAQPQQNPQFREHQQRLIKLDSNGNLQWSGEISTNNFEYYSTLHHDLTAFARFGDEIFAGGKVFDSNGTVIRSIDGLNSPHRLGDYQILPLAFCLAGGGGYNGGGCTNVIGYQIVTQNYLTGDRQWLEFRGPDWWKGVITDDSIFVLTSERTEDISFDYRFDLRRHDDAFNLVLTTDINDLFGVDLYRPDASVGGQLVDTKPALIKPRDLSNDVYLVDYVYPENTMLVARINQNLEVVWSQQYAMPAGFNADPHSDSKMVSMADGSIVYFFSDVTTYDVFRFDADDGRLISSSHYPLATGVTHKHVTVNRNGQYIALQNKPDGAESGFVLLESLVAP